MSQEFLPNDDRAFMRLALAQAQVAADAGEVPVGAVVVRAGQVVASAHNAPVSQNDPTAHAEVNAMRAAAKVLGNYRLEDCTLYVTLEPCAMCSGAALHARFKRVVFGAAEPKTGAAGSVLNVFAYPQLNHQTEVTGGILASECAEILRYFFEKRRAHQQLHKFPLREDALRTPENAWQGLNLPTHLSCFTTDLPALKGLRLHWFDNRKDSSELDLFLHGSHDWSAAYLAELASSGHAIALDLPGFGGSDKPKKDKVHNLAWHAQVVVEFLAHLNPVPTTLHAPQTMAPMVNAVRDLWHAHASSPFHIQWYIAADLAPALRDAPYPDAGHRAGPRALSGLLAMSAEKPTPQS